MGREAQEAKLQKQLEKLRKQAKSKTSKTKKPLKMDRESVEKRRQAKLEEIRLQRKAEKQMKSIKAELKKLNQPKGLYSKDKLEKLQMFGKKKKSKPKVTEMGLIDDKIPKGEYCVSTSNRNFEGRQGPGARTMLVSPLSAAVIAVEGKIVDARNYLGNEVSA